MVWYIPRKYRRVHTEIPNRYATLESYVTGSLVAVAFFQIRQGYVEVIECDDTDLLVKRLAEILGDPYAKKSPLPRIGPITCLPVSPSIPSH